MSRKAQYRLRHVDQEDREVALQDESEDKNIPLGIYGWKKRILYCCVFLLFAIILLNLALTIWILAVLNFSVFGTGNIVFSNEGLQVKGPAVFDSDLITSSIVGTTGSELKISSQNAVSLRSGDSTLLLQDEYVNITSNQFRVRLPSQSSSAADLLAVEGSTVRVGADLLEVKGGRGLSVSGGLNASGIRGHAGGNLDVVSMSGELGVTGRSGLRMTSVVGNVEMMAGQDLILQSNDGSIILESDEVKISGLLLGDRNSPQSTRGYQLCVCGSGKLFLADASNSCTSYSACT
jgi:delta-sarcoglycan